MSDDKNNRTVGRPRVKTDTTERKDKSGKLINGGMHNTRAYLRLREMIEGNDYTEAHLYHLVLFPLESQPSLKDYQSAVKAICLKLSRAGIAYKWRAALELDDVKEKKGKGLHYHIFLMIEGNTVVNGKKVDKREFFGIRDNQWLRPMLKERGIALYMAPPQDEMHNGNPYATLPKSNQAKIDDCLTWASYIVKSRSKIEYSPTHKTTYFSSRDNKKAITP